jgi:hypothetical protein
LSLFIFTSKIPNTHKGFFDLTHTHLTYRSWYYKPVDRRLGVKPWGIDERPSVLSFLNLTSKTLNKIKAKKTHPSFTHQYWIFWTLPFQPLPFPHQHPPHRRTLVNISNLKFRDGKPLGEFIQWAFGGGEKLGKGRKMR